MNLLKVVGILFIVGGALGLAYGSFSLRSGARDTKLGPIVLSVKNKETYRVPMWAGIASMVAGSALLFFT